MLVFLNNYNHSLLITRIACNNVRVHACVHRVCMCVHARKMSLVSFRRLISVKKIMIYLFTCTSRLKSPIRLIVETIYRVFLLIISFFFFFLSRSSITFLWVVWHARRDETQKVSIAISQLRHWQGRSMRLIISNKYPWALICSSN